MDYIEDKERKIFINNTYLSNLQDLQNKVNPKPYTPEEREQILKKKIALRNKKIGGFKYGT